MLLECSQVQTSPSHCSAQCCAVFAHQTLPQDTASHSKAVKCCGRGDFVSFGAFPPTQRLLFPTLAGFSLQCRTWGLGGAD